MKGSEGKPRQVEVELKAYRGLVEQASIMLTPYFIGFVRLSVKDGAPDAQIGGSGTLVSIDDTKGVLTAAHVINALMHDKEVGIVLASRSMQRIVFPTEHCRPIILYEDAELPGPDLGLLILPPDTMASLEALMSFYNLSKDAERMLRKPTPLQNGFWGLTGFAAEFARDCNPPKGFSKAKVFQGGFGAGIVLGESERRGFDYISYEALYNEFYEGPETFGGFSGGGLWQMLVDLDGEEPQIRGRELSGVAFYQSAKMPSEEGDRREILCHGRGKSSGRT